MSFSAWMLYMLTYGHFFLLLQCILRSRTGPGARDNHGVMLLYNSWNWGQDGIFSLITFPFCIWNVSLFGLLVRKYTYSIINYIVIIDSTKNVTFKLNICFYWSTRIMFQEIYFVINYNKSMELFFPINFSF